MILLIIMIFIQAMTKQVQGFIHSSPIPMCLCISYVSNALMCLFLRTYPQYHIRII